MEKKSIVIGLAGNAGVGKDTFFLLLKDHLENVGMKCERFAFADALKEECRTFLDDLFGINPTLDMGKEEKALVRPILVSVGEALRKNTKGQYFIQKLRDKINQSDADVKIITDVRFWEYDNDEYPFVLDELGGNVVMIMRSGVEPANILEKQNNHKMSLDKRCLLFIPNPIKDMEDLKGQIVKFLWRSGILN
jgi:hypothetical protein